MKVRHLLLCVLVTAIWGANFSVIKLGLQSMDAFVLAGVRFTLCALPAVFVLRRPRVPPGYLAGYGLLFGVGLWGVVNLGIQAGASAGIASLVLQLSAFFTILLGAAVFREPVSRWQYAGIAVALAGLGCTIGIADGSASPAGLALVVAGALSWAAANVLIKRSGTQEVLAFVVWSSLFAPLPLFALALAQHGPDVFAATWHRLDTVTVASILFQAYPTTLFGYWIWNAMLRRYPVSVVAPLSLLVPVFGLAGSALVFGERIGGLKLAAAGLIVLELAVGLYGRQTAAALRR
ncbi:EamA family transporter [Xylophilus sp.]|uniref:EamA family transporter n=1 Tax=Xylophilus sp. TaxID=2653893 RepID=UPI0013B8E48A|nr:EamA family transporter [Xylophilus sp.]KAF1047822.1 MAG: putative amino-acid metabolite efflux pump [Xylophilus sp.]